MCTRRQKNNKNKGMSLRANTHSIRTMTKQIRCVNRRIKKSKHKIKTFHSAELEAFSFSDQLATWAAPTKARDQEAPPGCRVFLPWNAEPHLPWGNLGVLSSGLSLSLLSFKWIGDHFVTLSLCPFRLNLCTSRPLPRVQRPSIIHQDNLEGGCSTAITLQLMLFQFLRTDAS